MLDKHPENTTVESLDGPSKTSQPIKIKGPVKDVARLSKNSKMILSALGVAVVIGIVVGTTTAGHKNKNSTTQGNTGSSTETIGSTPIDPDIFKSRTTTNTDNTPPAAPTANNGPLAARGTPPADAAAASAAQQQSAQQPKQQYLKWLSEQHYKQIEGKILAADAAVLAEPNTTNQGGLTAHESGFGTTNNSNVTSAGASRIRDAQDAALKEIQNNPNLTKEQIQKLLKDLPTGDGTGQAANKQFVAEQQTKNDGYLDASETPKADNHELFAGSVIPAVLLSGIDSDLPGVMSAMVRQTIYDSLNPNIVLIPQGTKLIGEYSAGVAYGQTRVLAAWTRLIFPNGSTIDLKGMLGADEQGLSGFNDQVDNHFMKIFGSSILISLLGVGAELSQPQNSGALNTPPASTAAASALATSLDQTGTTLLNKNLQIQPTLNIRQGYMFNVMVNRTMIMPPY